MPEPLSIATATIGTTLAVLGFVVGTLSNLNRAKRSIIDFRDRLQVLVRSLQECKRELQDLDALWGYDKGDETFFRHIWGKEFRRINNERLNVSQNVKSVDEYVTTFLGLTYKDVTAWTDGSSEIPGRLWLLRKRWRFSLFSEETIRTKIGDLEKSVTNLSKLYAARQQNLMGDNPGQQVSIKDVRHFRALAGFSSELWELRRLERLRRYSQWTIELWPLGWDGSTDLLDWERSSLNRVQLWFSFHVPAGSAGRGAGGHRVKLDYHPGRKLSTASWTEMLTDETPRGRNSDENPQIEKRGLLLHRTRPFRHLFAHNFFAQPLVYKAWQSDLSQLLVSLTNWSALLWNTNWTANLCSSGLRYVRETPIDSQLSNPCLHTLSHRRDHEPGGNRVEDGIRIHNDYDTCIHADPQLKLRNLGLVLAELVCAQPFRFCEDDDSQYEQWSTCNEAESWVPVTLNEILGMVESKSGSVSVRESVQFCLTSTVRADEDLPWEGYPTFIHEYIEKVIQPFKAWANRVQAAANHPQINRLDNLTGVRPRRWPQDAFEDQVAHPSPRTFIGVWAFLEVEPTSRYIHVGGVICFMLVMFSFFLFG